MKRIKKGDNVEVITGKEKGKKGKVVKLDYAKNRVTVEGLNVAKKHRKKTQDQPGGIVDIFVPLSLSNIMLICNKCQEKTKINYLTLEDGKKVRKCKKCQEVIDK
jgi:large subunit ribosomal protein L24